MKTTELLKQKVAFPSDIREQQKIASILSKVDELIQKTDQIIEQTQRLKKGLMQRLLTRGIGHTKFIQTKIGNIPRNWQVTQLTDITLEHKQGYYTNEVYVKDGIKLVRISDLYNPRLSYETWVLYCIYFRKQKSKNKNEHGSNGPNYLKLFCLKPIF